MPRRSDALSSARVFVDGAEDLDDPATNTECAQTWALIALAGAAERIAAALERLAQQGDR